MSTTDPIALAAHHHIHAAVRVANLAKILEGYEVGMPDSSVPGAARPQYSAQRYPGDAEAGKLVKHPRYALVSQYDDKGNYRVCLADDLAGVERVAAQVLTEGDAIACYFDLDELAGEEELPKQVLYKGAIWDVIGHTYENAEKTGRWTLRKDPTDRRRSSYDWESVDPADVDTEGWEDERMPVRYGLAKIVVSVVFNTVPSP